MLNTVVHGSPGGRPPLLIAHGLFGSARNWGMIAKALADDRQVVAVDMRNHGSSPWFDTHSYPQMADDLAQVIDGRWDVLGHSMGGKAAMVLALQHPDKVRKLVVADIAPVAYTHTQMGPLEAMRRVDLSVVESRSDAAAQMADLSPELQAFLLQSLDMKEKRWRLNLDVLADEMPRIVGFPDVAGVFDGPALFVSGARSDYVTPAHHDAIKALFPNAEFTQIADAGHWLHAEQPRPFAAAVAAFLA